jgi:hypothetical protein
MNVYHYIAESNPDAANEVCKKYGYFQINSIDELANCLQGIVAQEGEKGLKDVMTLHPDKDVLIELFDKKKDSTPIPVVMPQPPVVANADGCACNKNANADGTTPSSLVNQTNMYILFGAVIVSIAILSYNKSR